MFPPNSVDDANSVTDKFEEAISGWKTVEWYDCILAQGKNDADVKTRLLTLLAKYKGNNKKLYDKLLKLNEYKLDLGIKDFKLADNVSNVSPSRLNPLVKSITNKHVDSLKQKSGLTLISMYISYPISKLCNIFPLLAIGIPLRNNNNYNYNNNYNNNNYNNNNNGSRGGGRGNSRGGRGGGCGGRSNTFNRRRWNSCQSRAVGIPPLPEIERFKNNIKDKHPEGPYGTICINFQSDNCHSPNGQKYCDKFHVCRKCGLKHPANNCHVKP